MNPWIVFAAAGGISWVLRIMFIDLLPARKLPERVRAALELGGPAAMAALVTSEFVHLGSGGGGFAAAIVGTLTAGFVTYRFGNLAASTVAGIAAYALTLFAV